MKPPLLSIYLVVPRYLTDSFLSWTPTISWFIDFYWSWFAQDIFQYELTIALVVVLTPFSHCDLKFGHPFPRAAVIPTWLMMNKYQVAVVKQIGGMEDKLS